MPDDYAHLNPALLAVLATERTLQEVKAAMGGSSERWWLAISDAHQALTAALVAAISGTAEMGALSSKAMKAMIQYFDDPSSPRPKNADRIANFTELLDRSRDPAYVNLMWGTTLTLSESQHADLLRIDGFRNDLAHVKPGSWSLEIAGLPRIFSAVAEALRQLFEMVGVRKLLQDHELVRGLNAIDQLQSLSVTSSLRPPVQDSISTQKGQ